MLELRSFGSQETLHAGILDLLRATLASPGNLMLSGGTTPGAIYGRLAAAPVPVHPGRRLFLSDERMVPAGSGQNNAHNLAPVLLALGCADRFVRVDTGLAIEEAAARFEAALRPMDKIDLGLLGMGSDGHTAGIFTCGHARENTGPLVLHTRRPDGMGGVSVTPALFARVGRIVLLVAGASKQQIVRTLLDAPGTIPAGVALRGHPQVELWTDIAVS